MATIFDVADVLVKIKHPSINFSLTELGMIDDIDLDDNIVSLCFVFPFPKIPIAADLIKEVKDSLHNIGLDLKHTTRIMDVDEKGRFLKMEKEGWKSNSQSSCGQ